MTMINLNGQWSLVVTSPDKEELSLTANVPGSVLNDITVSNIGKALGDIFYRDNADKYLKFEKYSWMYSKTFEIDDISERLILILAMKK